ncbi:DMT family transporter [Aestuariivirga sp.]|uniref:DMT family transporter n=1 Tax=Aestuariivirga sp. TaxID=2650926 RepID=UPI0039E659DD
MTQASAALPSTQPASSAFTQGVLLVAGAALVWSFGGTIARFIRIADPWTIVFWRSLFAALFLLAFMLWRDGLSGTVQLFRAMGLPGIGVGLCFAGASSAYVVALQHTTVANILLIQAAAPLCAALMVWVLFREKVSLPTWAAIVAVIAGVGIMVSASFSGKVSPLGDGLAILIVLLFSTATVITRHAPRVRMTPAVCFGMMVACAIGAVLAGSYSVDAVNLGWLFLFGAVNLGFGLALFATGARLIPAAVAALVSTLEPVLGPVWVWLIHNEVPGERTIIGGTVVFLALLVHILTDWQRQRRSAPPVA